MLWMNNAKMYWALDISDDPFSLVVFPGRYVVVEIVIVVIISLKF